MLSIWLEGKLLTGLPLLDRRKVLQSVLPPKGGIIRLSQLFDGDGVSFYETAKSMKLEGIIAKKADSIYMGDHRSREWLKVKAKQRQEVIIAGYTRNEDSGKYFSALCVGVYNDQGILTYLGKVGTGFDTADQKELLKTFKPLETKVCPFQVVPDVDEPSRRFIADAD